jgi:hypothetical protein
MSNDEISERSFNNSSPYLLAAYRTDNKFKSSDVISHWHHIYEKSTSKGILIIGYATDCNIRYLNAMRACLGVFVNYAFIDHPDAFEIN